MSILGIGLRDVKVAENEKDPLGRWKEERGSRAGIHSRRLRPAFLVPMDDDFVWWFRATHF